jgi:hypothetical protein
MNQFVQISNNEFRQSFHETIESIRVVCDQDKIHENMF